MKFKIVEDTEVVTRNLYGRVLTITKYYHIDIVKWYFFHFPLNFDGRAFSTAFQLRTQWPVKVRLNPIVPTKFDSKEDAQRVIDDIQENPDKYIRVYY